MRNKPKWYSAVLLGLVLLLASSVVGCAPVLTLFGFRVVEHEDTLGIYGNETTPMLEEWKDVINDWEDKASDPERSPYRAIDAECCYNRMQLVISDWATLSPPDEAKEYHLWIQHAMEYEKEAFRVMAEYYSLDESANPEDFDRLYNLAVELWTLKDKALLKADVAAPK